MQRILFIINPISGTRNKKSVEQAIRQYIDPQKFDYSIRYTEYAGHAAELATAAVEEKLDIVVAVGGDGTVNEVARALVHTNTALGIVPCGSGNGLARHLKIPLQAAKAVALIGKAHVALLDSGRINQQAFFCTCGVGFDAFISMKFAEAGKRGLSTYVEKALTDGLHYQPEEYVLTVGRNSEEQEQCKAFLIACANASQYGNDAFIAPHASMEDGLMDITILEPFSLLQAPLVALQLFNKTLPDNSHARVFRTDYLRIERPEAGVAHCDGDPFHTEAVIEVELLPKSLHVVVNDEAEALPTEQNVFLRMLEPFQQLKTQSERLGQRTMGTFRKMGTELQERLNFSSKDKNEHEE